MALWLILEARQKTMMWEWCGSDERRYVWRKGPAPISARWRWTARGAFLAALAAVVLPLLFAGLRSVALLVLGVAGVTITAAGAWWAVTRRGVRRALGVIVAVVGLLGVVAVYALARFLLIAIVSVALLLLAGFMARATLRACARPVPEYETAPPAHPFIIMNPRSGGGKVVRFQLVERAEALGARVALLDGDQHVDVVALAREAVARGADLLGVAGGDGTQAPGRRSRSRPRHSVPGPLGRNAQPLRVGPWP